MWWLTLSFASQIMHAYCLIDKSFGVRMACHRLHSQVDMRSSGYNLWRQTSRGGRNLRMNITPCTVQPEKLRAYQELFAKCFPTAHHLNANYLDWLYQANPEGHVVGFDAYEGDNLAAHYACIPAAAHIDGQTKRGLLSLNTATHPDYQGKGLFTKLASATYEHAANSGFEFVYGVANANSTPGFLKKLGFSLVQPLDARVGFGRLSVDWAHARRDAAFYRAWNDDTVRWRISNPANPIKTQKFSDGSVGFECSSWKTPLIRAYAENSGENIQLFENGKMGPTGKVFVGLFPSSVAPYRTYFEIPKKLRPSVLNLIFRDLKGSSTLDNSRVLLNFLDFDAF